MNKKLLILISVLVPISFGQLRGQEIIRQSISSLASGANPHGLYVNQTVGQPFSTLSTSGSNLFYNPGFQQLLRAGIKKEQNLMDLSDLTVYPNPASREIHVNPDGVEDTHLKVTDMTGRIVFVSQEVPQQHFTINCSAWQPGFYMISIYNRQNQKIQTSKIIISK